LRNCVRVHERGHQRYSPLKLPDGSLETAISAGGTSTPTTFVLKPGQ
jgi:hypothetical protein